MKLIITILVLFGFYSESYAQYEAVVFDYALSYFNNGQPLPAEEKLLFSGPTSPETQLVKVGVYNPKSDQELYHALWKRNRGETANNYRIPFNFRLKGNETYDIHVSHYARLQNSDKSSLKNNLEQGLYFLIDELVVIEEEKVNLAVSKSSFLKELNRVVFKTLDPYVFENEWEFEGFSQTARLYINQVEKKFDNPQEDSTHSLKADMNRHYRDKVETLYQLVRREIAPIFDQQILLLTDKQVVRDYPTEKISGSLAISAGYGGVYLDGEWDDFTYDSAPYIGLSFPLSRRINTNPVLNNTSISIGAFISDFEDKSGNDITGPIFGKPYFVGLGYRLFRFVRLNAGAVILEEKGTSMADNGNVSIETSEIKIRPFIGISAEINLTIGLGNR